jgi:RHS repeat-associated protein
MMRNGVRRTITSFTGTTRDVNDPNATMSRLLILHHPDGSKTYYVYGLGLLYEVDQAEQTKTYHCDQVGSTIARTNDSGAVIGKAEYSAYGICFWKQGDMDTPFQYNGQWGVQTDSNGLLNMRARYYSPNLMRFLNADPIGFSGGQNWFAYADGDPISKSDPFGLWGWRNTLSLALDFIPIVGTVKAAVEVVAGYDFIAGEEVNRGIAAAGLVAGLVPGGKAAVKGGSKLSSTAVKNADEAAEIGEMVVKNGDGFIYKRTNPLMAMNTLVNHKISQTTN